MLLSDRWKYIHTYRRCQTGRNISGEIFGEQGLFIRKGLEVLLLWRTNRVLV